MPQIETPQIIPEFETPFMILSNPGKHTIRGDWRKFHRSVECRMEYYDEFSKGLEHQVKVIVDKDVVYASRYERSLCMEVQDVNGQYLNIVRKGFVGISGYLPDPDEDTELNRILRKISNCSVVK